MSVVLDTCILSDLRKPRPNPAVTEAIASFHPEAVFITVVTCGEIRAGISGQPDPRQQDTLKRWYKKLLASLDDPPLPVTIEAAEFWGHGVGKARRVGRTVSPADGLIAGVAMSHGFSVMTLNVKDFEPTGVEVLDPRDWMPDS